ELESYSSWYMEYRSNAKWRFDFHYSLQRSNFNDLIEFSATTVDTQNLAGSAVIPYVDILGIPKPNLAGATICLSSSATLVCLSSLPLITSLSAPSVPAGSSGFTLTLNGSNFANGAVVNWTQNGQTTVLATQVVNSATITAQVPASLLTTPGSAQV